jgi:hypothetical protein
MPPIGSEVGRISSIVPVGGRMSSISCCTSCSKEMSSRASVSRFLQFRMLFKYAQTLMIRDEITPTARAISATPQPLGCGRGLGLGLGHVRTQHPRAVPVPQDQQPSRYLIILSIPLLLIAHITCSTNLQLRLRRAFDIKITSN